MPYPRTVVAVLLALAWLAGVGFGAYYRDELFVYYLNQTGRYPLAPPTPTPATPHTSSLKLPGLGGPLPLVYSDTLEEARLQEYLREGAVVLPLGASFGAPGNVVVTAHSSGTAAFGPYRFAFAKLAELQPGQEYEVITPAARYTYRVYGQEIVWPHEVDRLPSDDRATVTLVTCWPLWTNFKRLLVHSELVHTESNI